MKGAALPAMTKTPNQHTRPPITQPDSHRKASADPAVEVRISSQRRQQRFPNQPATLPMTTEQNTPYLAAARAWPRAPEQRLSSDLEVESGHGQSSVDDDTPDERARTRDRSCERVVKAATARTHKERKPTPCSTHSINRVPPRSQP